MFQFYFWPLRKLLLLLSGDTSPRQIAAGAVIGVALGLMPITLPIWWFLFILVLFLRISIGMVSMMLLVLKLVAIPFDPFFADWGTALLHTEFLKANIFEPMWNTPWLAISGFNHPLAAFAVVSTLVLSPLLFWLMLKFVSLFRARFLPRLQKIWIIKYLKGSDLFKLYCKLIG